jgi:hypothetical protein
MLAPSVLAALARGASARALRAQDVAPAANPPALEVRVESSSTASPAPTPAALCPPCELVSPRAP